MKEVLGGARSQASAQQATTSGGKSFRESIGGKGDINQFTDLSNPQTETARKSTAEEDERARKLLGMFGWINASRAVLMAAGGAVGLFVALQ